MKGSSRIGDRARKPKPISLSSTQRYVDAFVLGLMNARRYSRCFASFPGEGLPKNSPLLLDATKENEESKQAKGKVQRLHTQSCTKHTELWSALVVIPDQRRVSSRRFGPRVAQSKTNQGAESTPNEEWRYKLRVIVATMSPQRRGDGGRGTLLLTKGRLKQSQFPAPNTML